MLQNLLQSEKHTTASLVCIVQAQMRAMQAVNSTLIATHQHQQQHQQQQPLDDGSSGVGRGGESLMLNGGEGGAVFEKVRVLGRGSFGTVSLVRHKETKKMFAVKVIKHGDTRDERHRAMQEVRLMQVLNHACVIKLSDAFISSDGRSLW
jgi:serine/threonine protein kinase